MVRSPTYLITGASGQLGRLVVTDLLSIVPAATVRVMVRRNDGSFKASGVQVAVADYDQPQTLDAALAGIDRLLLISSNELGARLRQHQNVIDAAVRAGVKLIAYTSVLHADHSPLGLAEEHRQTEAAIQKTGVPYVFLRNGWYTENYTASIGAALAHGAVLGSSSDGRVSAASREDYAAAAVAAVTAAAPTSRIYELAGDSGFTLDQYAAEIARQTGRAVVYRDLPEAEFRARLLEAGLPIGLAELVAESSAKAAGGTLFDDGGQLSALIGRPTTPLALTVAAALRATAAAA